MVLDYKGTVFDNDRKGPTPTPVSRDIETSIYEQNSTDTPIGRSWGYLEWASF